jgi:hypothetical protein
VADDPIRTQTAFLIRGGLKNKTGTLLLYPDRISHVGSAGMTAGLAGGAIGMAVAGKLAKNKAADKEAEGGKGVTTMPLADVTEVRKAKSGLNRNLLEVVGANGTALMFAVKFDQWKPDVLAALQGAGRTVRDGGDVVTVS